MTASLFRRFNHLLMGSVRAAKLDIVLNRICKEVHALEHHRDILHQAVQLEIPYIRTAYGNLPGVHIPKTGNQVAHRCLTCPGRTDNSRNRFFGNGETDLIQYLAICVGKVHLVKHDLAGVRRNISAFLVHYRCVINGVCRIHRGRQHLQQRGHIPGVLQIVEHHERSNHQNQTVGQRQGAVQPEPDRGQKQQDTEHSDNSLFDSVIGNAGLCQFQVIPAARLNCTADRLRAVPFQSKCFDNPHPLNVLQHRLHKGLLCVLAYPAERGRFAKRQFRRRKVNQDTGSGHKTDPPVKYQQDDDESNRVEKTAQH